MQGLKTKMSAMIGVIWNMLRPKKQKYVFVLKCSQKNKGWSILDFFQIFPHKIVYILEHIKAREYIRTC